MSASLAVLVPLALLGLVAVLCFVGCGLNPAGTGNPVDFGDYQNSVLNTANLVAFWTLSDISGTTAADIGPNHFNGTYTQWPSAPYDSVNQSAAAPGTVTLDQSGIVRGDQLNNDRTPCAYFYGGFVSVPFHAQLNPPAPFTLEAWVIPDWDASYPPAIHAIVVAIDQNANTGFSLFADTNDVWTAALGIGTTFIATQRPPGSNQTMIFGTINYLVLTYDGTTLNLYVNPAESNATPYAHVVLPHGSTFAPSVSPLPLYIGIGLPGQQKPLFPFKGTIQDVAFYNRVLRIKDEIPTRFMNGNGIQMM